MDQPKLNRAPVFTDDRGTFFPLDISDSRWIQSNVSISKKWTFRGLHHQLGESAQTKLINVVKGEILDFVVDLRKGHFEEVFFFRMSPGDQLYVPKGCAHGFLALQDDTIIQYLVDNHYSPRTEISFDWKSVPTVKELILSEVGNENNLYMSPKDSAGEKLERKWAEDMNL
jgi:dTDP-4-dehydrorhamnose 3,5-epimerase